MWLKLVVAASLGVFPILISVVSISHSNTLLGRGQFEGGDGNTFRWKTGGAVGDPSPSVHFADFRTLLAMLLASAAASLSSAGGIGGGGLYVPIFNLLLGFNARTAAVLSNFTIFGGMLANMLWSSFQRDPIDATKPLVDLDAALAMQPCMLLGISLGVFGNVMFPGWLLTALLAITLACVTFRSCKCGLRMWKEETYLQSCSTSHPLLVDSEHQQHHDEEAGEEAERGNGCCVSFPIAKLLALVVVWLFFFAVQIFRGSKANEGYFHLKPCGTGYWIITSLQLPLTLVITIWTLCHLHKRDTPSKDTECDISKSKALPVMAFLAGVLGGLLGIGGGMLISPVLLEIGMRPQVTAATTAFMVFFSSSLSVVQYWLMGRIPVEYAIWFSSLCFLFSVLGLVVVHRAVERSGRASIIVFLVSSVMALSALLFVVFGALDIWGQLQAGDYMGFRSPC